MIAERRIIDRQFITFCNLLGGAEIDAAVGGDVRPIRMVHIPADTHEIEISGRKKIPAQQRAEVKVDTPQIRVIYLMNPLQRYQDRIALVSVKRVDAEGDVPDRKNADAPTWGGPEPGEQMLVGKEPIDLRHMLEC